MRHTMLFAALLIFAAGAVAQSKAAATQDSIPPNFVPTGKAMFKQYCAACHGMDAKGHGPARAALKVPAADLTTAGTFQFYCILHQKMNLAVVVN